MPIEVRDVSYTYMPGTPYETKALDGVDLHIRDGEKLAIVGHTGSGKSTLVQHFNGLLLPSAGEIVVNGISTKEKSRLREIRRDVGMVFQYPEHQLFEETVYKDIAFGPRNLGCPEEEMEDRIRHAMERMELDFDRLKDRSPFELSGGQQRRVAIAGGLAMDPGILIMDEPAAGLDPSGKHHMNELLLSLHAEGMTILFITHNMEEVAEIKGGQRKLVTRVRMPGYVLVRMYLTDESWGAVRNTPGVTGFVGHAHNPVPLMTDEVYSMLAPKEVAEAAVADEAPQQQAAVDLTEGDAGVVGVAGDEDADVLLG